MAKANLVTETADPKEKVDPLGANPDRGRMPPPAEGKEKRLRPVAIKSLAIILKAVRKSPGVGAVLVVEREDADREGRDRKVRRGSRERESRKTGMNHRRKKLPGRAGIRHSRTKGDPRLAVVEEVKVRARPVIVKIGTVDLARVGLGVTIAKEIRQAVALRAENPVTDPRTEAIDKESAPRMQ